MAECSKNEEISGETKGEAMERQSEETMEWERKQGLTARQVLPRRDYREAMGRGKRERKQGLTARHVGWTTGTKAT